MKSRSREYSETAYSDLIEYMEKNQGKKAQETYKEYATIAKKFPMLVRTAGLSQAVAFVATRDKKPQTAFLTHILQCIGYESQAKFFNSSNNDLMMYMLHTRQILQAANWYSRFSVSVLGVDEEQL